MLFCSFSAVVLLKSLVIVYTIYQFMFPVFQYSVAQIWPFAGRRQILDDGVDSINQFSTFLSKEKSDELSFVVSTCFLFLFPSTKGCAKSNLKRERSAPLPLVNID